MTDNGQSTGTASDAARDARPRLWHELRRRNVIRMAGLYLVGAWLLVQVAGTVLPMFGAPEWLPRSVVLLLALGFIPALVFAWVFELTPDGIKRDADVLPEHSIAPQTAQRMNRIILATLLLALVYFCLDKFVLSPRRDAALVVATTQTVKAAASTQATQAAEAARDNSIAVLPFVNMSGDKDNQYFSDGISEELLNVLVRVEDLSVASRTSSFAYRDKTMGSVAIARELKVGHILEGSVRKSGNKVRITAQLIDAVNDRHLWSETYDRELTDIFKIQDEIANAIVTALRGSLSAAKANTEVKVVADTENMAAYDLYLKARELFIARSDLSESVRLFERAVALDPKFARGWEGLAAVCAIIESWGFTDRQYAALSVSAARRALELDASLSMPWAALAMAEKAKWPIDYSKHLAQLDKAIAADPRNATAMLWRSIAWMELGFFDRAVADQDRCLAIEPGYHNCRSHKAATLLFRGDELPAFALLDENLAKGAPHSRTEHFVPALLARGNRTAALLFLDSMEMKPGMREIVIRALAEPASPRPDARAVISRYLTGPDDPVLKFMGLTHLYLWLGDYEAVGESDDSVTSTIVAWDRYPASFRNSNGMKRKLTRMGVVAYWRKAGFPPQCRATANNDFNCD